MSSKTAIGNEVTDGDWANEQEADWADAERFEIVDETPELRASVEQEIQAKVDTNHPDARLEEEPDHLYGKTLEQEECIRAREDELAHISAQAMLGRQDGRAERTRAVVTDLCGRGEVEAAEDPRERLSQAELAQVNQQAMRIDEAVRGGCTRAVTARWLAERIERGQELADAVLETLEAQKEMVGTVLSIGDVPEVAVGEVTVEGVIEELWTPSHPSISQVGLLADGSSRIKFTVWERSYQPLVREGERVRFRAAAKNWYNGRCSIALTGWSGVEFPERERWWTE